MRIGKQLSGNQKLAHNLNTTLYVLDDAADTPCLDGQLHGTAFTRTHCLPRPLIEETGSGNIRMRSGIVCS
jgi:hypothetical protein